MTVLAFHKAVGLVTTHRDEQGRETVYDRLRAQLPPALRRISWHAVGRLDKDTSGLLLFTDDGGLVHHATQPSSGLTKTYRALARRRLSEADLDRLRHGVELSGGLGISAPAVVRLIEHQIATTWIELDLHEGKNREVRRMLLAIDSQVIRLERIRVGTLALDLPVDGWRALSDEEVRAHLGYVRAGEARGAGREPRARRGPVRAGVRGRRR